MKKKGQGQGSMVKKGGEGGKKRRNGMEKGEERDVRSFSFVFLSRFLLPRSCFDAIPSLPFTFPLCPLYSVREAPRPTVCSSNHHFSYGRNSICLFPFLASILGKWRTVAKHVAGPRNSAKIEDTPVESFSCVIRYRSALFCTDLRSTQILIFLLRVIWRTH